MHSISEECDESGDSPESRAENGTANSTHPPSEIAESRQGEDLSDLSNVSFLPTNVAARVSSRVSLSRSLSTPTRRPSGDLAPDQQESLTQPLLGAQYAHDEQLHSRGLNFKLNQQPSVATALRRKQRRDKRVSVAWNVTTNQSMATSSGAASPQSWRNKLAVPNLTDDIYHTVFRWNLFWVFMFMLIGFVLINLVFGGLYAVAPEHCLTAGKFPYGLANGYFFSVFTFTTVGYGHMAPTCFYTRAISTLESFVSIVIVACCTGFFFAKLSRPVCRVVFSHHCCIVKRAGGQAPMLEFRMANERTSSGEIIEAKVSCSIAVEGELPDGSMSLCFLPLQLVRDSTPMFALSWTVSHKLDKNSPLVNPLYLDEDGNLEETPEMLDDMIKPFVTLIVCFTGIDDIYSQAVHARKRYTREDLKFNEVFEDIISLRQGGQDMNIDLSGLSNTRCIFQPRPAPADPSWVTYSIR